MAVIYGYISFSNNINNEFLEKVHRSIKWNNSKFHSVFWNKFSGGLFYNTCHPYEFDDFFFADSKSNIMILMSGIIYNKDDFKEEIELSNYKAPELILNLYKKLGIKFVERLNGDFAIFINDVPNKRSYLLRDHLGIRPLAFLKENDGLLFSSYYMDLCKSIGAQEDINKLFLLQFMQDGNYFEYDILPSLSVKKVLPAHYIEFSESSITSKKYWFPENIKINYQLRKNDVIKNLKTIVIDAIKLRCDNRFNASAHVSGGLDSGLVAALSKKYYSHQQIFYGFSWTPGGPIPDIADIDEREFVKEISNNAQIEPVFCNVELDDYFYYLRDWRYYSFTFREHSVLKKCIEKGVNLLFSGWGGDEFLSANNVGIDFDLVSNFQLLTYLKRNPITQPILFLKKLVVKVLVPLVGLQSWYDRPNDRWSYKYFNKPFNKRPNRNKNFLKVRSRKDKHLRLLYNYHLSWRTETMSDLGYRNGVEYRYPLLDKRIIELVLQIPSRIFADLLSNRGLIREISVGILPDKVRLHLPKEDSVRINHFIKLFKDSLNPIAAELSMIRNNPYLDFINFNQLEKDILKIKNGNFKGDETDFLYLINNIKQMHEFTKGYRG